MMPWFKKIFSLPKKGKWKSFPQFFQQKLFKVAFARSWKGSRSGAQDMIN